MAGRQRVADVTGQARAGGRMVRHVTLRIHSAGTGAGIFAFIIDARFVLIAVGI